MNLETFQKIVELVVTLIVLIVSTYVVPYIKSKSKQTDIDTLKELIACGVRCAEMYFDTKDGKAKKQYVLDYVKSLIGSVVKVEITDEQLDTIIEGVVQEVKYSYSLIE